MSRWSWTSIRYFEFIFLCGVKNMNLFDPILEIVTCVGVVDGHCVAAHIDVWSIGVGDLCVIHVALPILREFVGVIK